jgi:hypothetical protein
MSAESGVEHLSDRALASADRSWTGNDDSARQHHARLPLRSRPFTLALSWRESTNATPRAIGTYRIHLDVLLAHGLVRMDGPDHVRLRFAHAKSGSFLLQVNQAGPSVIVAAAAGKEGARESPGDSPAHLLREGGPSSAGRPMLTLERGGLSHTQRRTTPTPSGQHDKVLADLVAYVCAEGRICPMPPRWNEMWQLIPDRNSPRLAPPLILGGWDSPGVMKMLRLRDQILWAADRGALEAVDSFLRGLSEDEWFRLPD